MTTRGRIVAASVAFSAACGGQSETPVIPTQPTSVILPPSGTAAMYRVRGDVADSAGRPLRDATIIVVDGPQAGTTTMSDEAGRFEFGGITGLARIRAKKEGYVEQVKAIYTYPALEPGAAVVWFKLESAVRPPMNLAGTYTLTFSADPACSLLPDSVRTRRYATTLGPTGAWTLVTLTGAVFESGNGYSLTTDWNVIYLLLFEDFATLYFQDPPILELLSSGGKLMIEGHAAGTIAGASTEFAVTGAFGLVGAPFCRSTNHKLVLQRTGP